MSWAPERERSKQVVAGPLNICHACGEVNALEVRTCRRCSAPLRGTPAAATREPPAAEVRPSPDADPLLRISHRRPAPAPPLVPAGRVLLTLRALPEDRRLALRAGVASLLIAAFVAVLAISLTAGSGAGRSAPAARRDPKPAPRPSRASPLASRPAEPTPRHGSAAHAPQTTRAARALDHPRPSRTPDRPHTAPRPAGPLAVVAGYWRSIARGEFAAAYARLEPRSVPIDESQFVDYERSVGVESVSFSGRTAAVSGPSATVAVQSLTTQDRRFGCRSWSGYYLLARSGGRWEIARAAIGPGPCAG